MASLALDVVLVGLCDGELDTKRYRSTFMTNKVGGPPDVPPHVSRPCPRCSRCGAALFHVVQVYCPLEASPYHRTLNLFACPEEDCSGRSVSWRVFRSQSLEADTPCRPTPPHEPSLSATDWCESADDWGMDEGQGDDSSGRNMKQQTLDKTTPNTKEIPSADEMDVSSKLEELHLGSSEDNSPCFHPYFISVVEESDLFEEDYHLAHAQELLRDYEKREGVAVRELDDCEDGGGEVEKYEKTKARHGDAIFSRFMKKISVCPEQILRYCHGGTPLFISEPPANMSEVVSTCGFCGGSRTFELQLMPALVSLLEGKGDSSGTQLEFGTVLVYTCLNSCWKTGLDSAVEEFCYVQTDPDQKLFK